MKRIAIIQPGRLGDLIILAPGVVELQSRLRCEVSWPIFNEYFETFTKAFPSIDFIPVTNDIHTCIIFAYDAIADLQVDKIYDLAATFPGSRATSAYLESGEGLGSTTFDEFKYNLLDVDIRAKSRLECLITRDSSREDRLFVDLVGDASKHVVVGLDYSGGTVKSSVEIPPEYKQIKVVTGYRIFDWITTLKLADGLVLVDSSMSCLAEQLNLRCPKVLICKPDYPKPRLPRLFSKWRII